MPYPSYKDICCVSKLYDALKEFNPHNSYIAVSSCCNKDKGQFMVATMLGNHPYGRVFNLNSLESGKFFELTTETPKLFHTDSCFITEDGRKFRILSRNEFIDSIFVLAGIAEPQLWKRCCEACATLDLLDSDSEEEERKVLRTPESLYLQQKLDEQTWAKEAAEEPTTPGLSDLEERPSELSEINRKRSSSKEASGAPVSKQQRNDDS